MRGNACVRFFKDHYDIWYSKVAEMYALCRDRSLPMTTGNTMLFLSLPEDSEIVLTAVPATQVPEQERLKHFDYWGVIPVGVNPMQNPAPKKKRPATKVVDEMDEDIISDSEKQRRDVIMNYYIKKNYASLNKLPIPPMPSEVAEQVERTKILNPSAKPKPLAEKVTKNYKELSMLTEEINKFNEALVALQNAIPALLSASKAVAQVPAEPVMVPVSIEISNPCAVANVPTVETVKEAIEQVPFEYTPDLAPIPDSYFSEADPRKSIEAGVLRLCTALVSVKPYLSNIVADAKYPTETYADSRFGIETVTNTLLMLLFVLEEKPEAVNYSKSYSERVSAYARTLSNALSFQLESLPKNTVLAEFGPAFQADVIAITKALQAGLMSWRKLSKLL